MPRAPKQVSVGPSVERSRVVVQQVKQRLRLAIRQSGYPMARLARELGRNRAFLHNTLADTASRPSNSLKAETLFALLDLLEIHPASFFADLAPKGVSSPQTSPGEHAAGTATGGEKMTLEEATQAANLFLRVLLMQNGLKPGG